MGKFSGGSRYFFLSMATLTLVGAAAVQAAAPEAWFARLDRNHDQQLSPGEFKAGFRTRGRPVVYQRLPLQFRAVDFDHSGFLEADEFEALPIIQDAGADAPSLASVDTTPDARIDFREYVALVLRLDPSKN